MTRLVVGALALLLALAGCGGDPKAEPSPTTSAPVTTPASTTPSAAPPVMPEAAEANTKAGAIAFVRHYFELVNHAQATGELDELAAAEATRCESCTSGRKYLAEVYGSGGHIEGGDLSIEVLGALKNSAIAGWTVDGKLTYGPQTVVRPSATPTLEQLTGGGVPITVLLVRLSDQWAVAEWTRAR